MVTNFDWYPPINDICTKPCTRKTRLKVDQLDPSGGTNSTSSIARSAFSNKSKFIECVSSIVEEQHKEA